MRKEGDDVGVAVPPGCFKEGHAEVRGPFLVHIRLMRNPHRTYRPFIYSGFLWEITVGMIPAGILLSQAPEIVPPTNARGESEDHICSFCWVGDK